MAVSHIESAGTWLAKLMVKEVKYLGEVRDKVEDLQEELDWMQSFLLDADENQNKDNRYRKWVSKITDFALRSEDVVETYILKIKHKRQPGNVNYVKWLCCFWIDSCTLHYVGSDIDRLMADISKLRLRLQTYGVKSSYDKPSKRATTKLLADQRRTYAHVEEDVVGLEECIWKFEHQLVEGTHRVVVIHGVGGIGKTTLARKVLHHTKSRFDGVAWTYISQQLQLGSVCRDILLQLIPEKEVVERKSVRRLQDSQLLRKLCDYLKDKNCLVVLDDVCSTTDWKRLEPAFPLNEGSGGSKVLITTRDPKIFSQLGDNVVCYREAMFLDDYNSWKLLKKKANFNGNDTDPRAELGHEMLNHCKGHPLAIVVLGGVLETKKTLEEWQSVYDNLPSHPPGDESYIGVYEVLAMSYYELQYNLKSCFLNLGYFPKDFDIPVEKVYNLWIAEGIVSSTQEQVVGKRPLEDVAEVYLHELVQKGMVQVGSRSSDGEISTCRLHDLMRDKCLERTQEENFLQVVNRHASIGDNKQASPMVLNEKVRRLVINVAEDVSSALPDLSSKKVSPLRFLSKKKVSPLRSLLFFPKHEDKEENCEWIKTVCKEFQLLRIMDFEGLYIMGSLPSEVGNLVFLRYLSLKGTRITKLPPSIGNLRSLLILDLQVSRVVIELPNLLANMKSLRHLYFPSRRLSQQTNIPQGYLIEKGEMLTLDSVSHLEKLENVDLDRVDVNGLLEMRSMRKLSASCVSKKECLEPFVKSPIIKWLSLKIDAGILRKDPMILSGCRSLKFLHIDAPRYPPTFLPRNIEMFPQNLVELGFWYCLFKDDPMPMLEKLPKLKRLELHLCYYEKEMVNSDKGFPELTYLMLDGLFYLKKWTVERGCFPKLQKLEIHNSPIEELPDALPPKLDFGYTAYQGSTTKGVERYLQLI